ncbi:MAG: uL13 family ribosomal protein [Candidatus Shikimatogenerans sp. Ttur]|uniref:50S ribosomal protein L13 n=1 Tax=Candidatus Shikimatogenerans sp. Ttur TaxID=3158569 RepID=A0AAU7ZXR4_9FLAO
MLNCKNKILGRLSAIVVKILIGKYNIFYSPNIINGDNIILININKILINNKKKKYISYSGYPSGKKIKTFNYFLKKNPKKILLHSILGMIKNNKLKKNIKKNIYLYLSKEKFFMNNIKLIKIN